MRFSDNIPEQVLQAPNTKAFLGVLDLLQEYKTEEIQKTLRVNNFGVLLDNKWLIKRLADFGLDDIPLGYPTEILLQLLLNIDTFFGTRGCKIGVEFMVSVLTLGTVQVIDDEFFVSPDNIVLNSFTNGYLTGNSDDSHKYLVSDSEQVGLVRKLVVNVATPYWGVDKPIEVAQYTRQKLREWVGFAEDVDIEINFTYSPTKFYHKLLNPYFV